MTDTRDTTLTHSAARCECGHVRFSVDGPPLLRGFCHCSICQAFNNAPFADITLFRRKHVSMPDDATVSYRNFMKPAMLYRGSCVVCHTPAVEYLDVPLMPEVIIVPTGNLVNEALAPEPSLHIFYGSRVADVDDGLPKHSSYLPSQCAFGWRLLKGYLGR